MVDLPPFVPFVVAALLLPVVPRIARGAVLLAAPLAALGLLAGLEAGERWVVGFFDFELVWLRVDELSMPFGWVFAIAALLSGIYSLRLSGTGEQMAATAYAGSALGVVFAGDLLTLFIFWEIKALTSVLLIWSRRSATSGPAGMRYLFVHIAGGTVLLGGILWHLVSTGSLAFEGFASGPGGWLMLAGVALSAAIPPLHAWLPDAYPEATVPGTVYLSAFTTKAGVYVLARGFAGWELLIWAGVIMALYGVVYAVLENDIRRLLGYHIISQVGYMVAAVGIGTAAALNGATAHAFAHILYKGLLFMGAGAVLYATGRSKLTELGGLAPRMKLVVTLYLIGAFSISGVPLFSGFVSKELIVDAAYQLDGYAWVYYLLKLASVGTFLHTGLKLPWFTWFGPERGIAVARPVPVTMYVAMALTAGLNIAIGLFPGVFYELMPFAVDYTPYTAGKVSETVQLLVFTAIGFWLLLGKLGGEPTVTVDTDWLYRGLPRVLAPRAAALSAALPTPSLRAVPMRLRRRAPEGLSPRPESMDADRTGETIERVAGWRGRDGAPLPMWVLGVVVLAVLIGWLLVGVW